MSLDSRVFVNAVTAFCFCARTNILVFFLLKAALKKYQIEHKSKGESLEKCQGELKKLRRKSQGSKNPSKYGEKELQVSPRAAERIQRVAEGMEVVGEALVQ